MTGFYVFRLTDEDGLRGFLRRLLRRKWSLTYRLVPNEQSVDGCWQAKDRRQAIRLAARRTEGVYAACCADGLVVESWPATMTVTP